MRVEVVSQLSPPGLAGMICKRINNRILIYGGTYFPNNEPLVTSKVQSNQIKVYDEDFNLLFEQEGKISPDKGIAIQDEECIYYILGSSIYSITIKDKVEEECLGTFDFNIESGYGCKIGRFLFFGYQESYVFDLDTGNLIKKAKFPVEARGQGLSVRTKDELYYIGGANQKAYLDGFKYNFAKNQWFKIDYTLPNSVLGASSILINESELLILGGFNQEVYNQAIIDLKQPDYRKEYFSKGKSFFKWNQELTILDVKTGEVRIVGIDERFALCGAGFVKADSGYYVVSGECSPGRRTSEILLVNELI